MVADKTVTFNKGHITIQLQNQTHADTASIARAQTVLTFPTVTNAAPSCQSADFSVHLPDFLH